jgi:hypothetical protein
MLLLLLIASTALTGAALALRFRVLILVPAIGLAGAASIAGGVARGDSASAILTAAVIAAVSLQIGYVCGIVVQHAIAAGRALSSHAMQARSAR